MYFAAVALVGASFGQPPAMPIPSAAPIAQENQEHQFLADRQIKLPIKYEKDRKTIRQVLLFVARNGENLWSQEAAVTPDRDFFLYTAKEDGVYWFTMVIEDLQGRRDPADMTRIPPDLKVIVDTAKPNIHFTKANRSGETVVIVWFVDDKYPDENRTRVHFKPVSAPEKAWQAVSLHPSSKSGVEFSAGTTEPVMVRVTAYDMALNKTEAIYTFPQGNANTAISTSTRPPFPSTGTPPPPISPPVPVVTPSTTVVPPGPTTPQNNNMSSTVIPPPDAFAPVPPSPPPSVPAISPTMPPAPSQTQGSGTPSVVQPALNSTPSTSSLTLSGFGSPVGGSTIPTAPTVPSGPMSPVATPVVPPPPMVSAP
ncbi:MAG TPA: hypothetical protein VG122_08285, partial [Gemmata sp.]|nr:hypothetical protein [Gemmata sp.]